MVKVTRTCPRCGRLVDEKEVDPFFDYHDMNDVGCEWCTAEYEAILERQKEERRLFWEGEDEDKR